MATVTPTPFVLKDYLVTLGDDDFEAAVSSAALTPSASVVTFTGGSPGSVWSETTSATWTLDLTFAQSYDTTDLSIYLFDNEGETVAFALEPQKDGVGFTGNVVLSPGAIGGAVNQFGQATVSLGVQGKPTKVVPTP